MSFLLDTDILSLMERKNIPTKLSEWAAENKGWFISVVTLAELEYGLQQAPPTHRSSLAQWIKNVRANFADSTEPLNEPVLIRWKELLSDLKKKRRTMSCEDSLIAATALHYGHTVATCNVRHFEPADVEVFNPLA